ncbi:YdcF family protein [Daejeonella oryzae]|uniref:YdcF family protein n=1 Tax=Daejeonella oryzae TaxID=1122943 RepID=UPI000427C509|nr:YdcF family protein [Daejeonella oryzae]
MYYYVSKILIHFLNPFIWILIFLILSFALSNKVLKKRFLILSTVIFILFSNKFLLKQFASRWDIEASAVDHNKLYSCAIVLGGMASEDKNANGFFNGASDRFIQVVKLKTTNRVSNIFVSGGNNSLNPSSWIESTWVINELKSLNFPDSILLSETRSRNTLENAALTRQTLEGKNLKPPYVLVTSAFHMRRALLIFKNAGIEVIPHPCNFSTKGKISVEDFIPSLEALGTWPTYIKEIFAYSIVRVKSQ